MRPNQADKLIWLSENATQEEYETYWDEVQEEHSHSHDKMCTLIGLRYGLNKALGEES
ncbi:hypothetical protein [Bacillus cereus]|uniref:hypothetical protein n=1 Tax=Bacillus cereus TaxID=1396 RepID=UPI00159655F0|nr:hypothetical protein [Bacillus cereus]